MSADPNYRGKATIIIPGPKGKGERIFYSPTEKQDTFHFADVPNVLYGGAAGGGKSHAIRMDAYIRCLSVPGFRALLLRRTFPELRSTHIEKAIFELPQLGGVYAKSEFMARFPNGSSLEFGHCEDDAAAGKYLSTEYDAVFFDELVTFTRLQYKFISSRARTTKPGLRPCVRAASNPGGANSHWVKALFVDKNVDPEEEPNYDPAKYLYIPATLDDNPHIDPTYASRLMDLPSHALRMAYRYGSWDFFEGQYFSEWRALSDPADLAKRGLGHADDAPRPWHVIHELPTINGKELWSIPWLEVVRAIDWGYRDPGVCGWYALLPDGRAIKFQEYVFREMLAKDVAKEIKLRSRGMRVRYTVADPAMWTKDGSAGESIAETFQRNGVPLQEADNDRVNGWHRVHSWLKETTNHPPVPLLQIYAEGCPYTVRTLPACVIDPNRPEDVKTKNTEDHAADETRYFVMSRPAPSRQSNKKNYSPLMAGWGNNRFLEHGRTRKSKLGDESTRRRTNLSWKI